MNFDYAQQNVDIFPRLKSVAIVDSYTAPECMRMNGVVADVNDPIWHHNVAPRHFNCRCYEELVDKYDTMKSTGAWDKKRIMKLNDEGMQAGFKMNPAKDKKIFQDKGKGKHPYFVVAAKNPQIYKQLGIK